MILAYNGPYYSIIRGLPNIICNSVSYNNVVFIFRGVMFLLQAPFYQHGKYVCKEMCILRMI